MPIFHHKTTNIPHPVASGAGTPNSGYASSILA
jgi:hypothetical protein